MLMRRAAGRAEVRPELEFEDFFRGTLEQVIGALTLVTHDRHKAEDSAQEAYTRAYRSWDKVGAMERPDIWVLRVGTNLAINAWRRTKRESELDALPPAREPSAGNDSERLIHDTWIEWGLGQLTAQQRAAFVLHHAQGWDLPKVAQHLGTTESTVSSSLHRTRHKLRALLGEELSS
jgi:RNA polymerase sigma factor (sigma-70 family)